MKVVLQRVSRASVTVEEVEIAKVGQGILLLAGIARGDTGAEADWLAGKISGLRIFEDSAGKMNLSVKDLGAEVLAVSQFTLLADTRKGKRPNFMQAADPAEAEALFNYFCERLSAEGLSVQTGKFGAMMDVELTNNGPVTIILER